MTFAFLAVVSPDSELLQQISDFSPQSPFNTPAYALALSVRNAEPCALVLKQNQEIVGGCLAALAGSRWNRRLEVISTPALESPEDFWQGVADFCRTQSVCDLDVQTFASSLPSMPRLGRKLSERDRSEFIVDLANDRIFDSFSTNHKRSIKKAQNAALQFEQSTSLDDYLIHVQVMQASMIRRSDRGERVVMPSAHDFDYALLENGVGELFQAKLGDQILASILVLKSATSGYYHSAGTLPEGMQLGASPFLIGEVISVLASSGYKSFNLGGVDPGADGLRRFKSGFGAQEAVLSAATYSMISPLNRAIRAAARSIKNAPRAVLSFARE